jgi:putative two-component system response regulator
MAPEPAAAYRETLLRLAKLVEAREDATGRHLERIRIFCELLARRLSEDSAYAGQLSPAAIRNIVEAAPLHDIGKVAIPDAIVLKPGKLTPEEFAIMKTHAALGADVLAPARGGDPGDPFLRVASEIARSHHEKWDGSGYPSGLTGEKIPLAARILAVADVYDALTARRCYKKPSSHERSREIILQAAGRHFDPVVVRCFEALAPTFQTIRE